MNKCRLVVDNVSVIIGARALLRGICFSIGRGELLVLAGCNGIGKTSLLRILAGLSEPLVGEVRWGEHSIYPTNVDFLGASAYLGHRLAIKQVLTVEENLRWSASLYEQSPDIDNILSSVSLSEQRNINAGALSAGQLKRLALARLLVANRALWIIDEIFSSVDAQGINDFKSLLDKHLSKGGMVIATSHQDVFEHGACLDLEDYRVT